MSAVTRTSQSARTDPLSVRDALQRLAPTDRGCHFPPTESRQPLDHRPLPGDQPLPLGVLGLQRPQPPGIGHIQASVSVAPAKERLPGEIVPADHAADLRIRSLLHPQDPDDPLAAKACLRPFREKKFRAPAGGRMARPGRRMARDIAKLRQSSASHGIIAAQVPTRLSIPSAFVERPFSKFYLLHPQGNLRPGKILDKFHVAGNHEARHARHEIIK